MVLPSSHAKAGRPSTSGWTTIEAQASELTERDYNSALESATGRAIEAAWQEHKAQGSTMPRSSDTAATEKVRAIISTMYLSEIRARLNQRLLMQADVTGHSVVGRGADQVVEVRATNTLLYLTGGKALAGVGDSRFTLFNCNEMDGGMDDRREDEAAEERYEEEEEGEEEEEEAGFADAAEDLNSDAPIS